MFAVKIARNQGDLVPRGSVVRHTVVGCQVAFKLLERRRVCALCNQRVKECPVQFPAQGRLAPIVAIFFIESPFKYGFGGNGNRFQFAGFSV